MTGIRRAVGPAALLGLALSVSLSGCNCNDTPVGLVDGNNVAPDATAPIGYDDAGNPIYPDASTPVGYDDAGKPIYPDASAPVGYDDAGNPIYPDASTPVAFDDAGNPIYPDASLVCLDPGVACVPGAQPLCCSGLCVTTDAGVSVCKAPTLCSGDGAPCVNPTECCSMFCSGGTCGRQLCKQAGSACGAPGECCSGLCNAGTCAALPTSCTTLGEACTNGYECCSKNCQGGLCLRASSCSAAGDICYTALDCCNGQCDLPAAGGPGVCAAGVTVPGATNCGIGGEPCAGSGNCCSHLCLDLGSGQPTCVLGSGCRERGEICVEDSECCGSSSSGVFCSKAFASDLVGRCSNKQACQPVGNCCGLGANCEQACCDGKKAVCKIDAQGLSRCFGGGSVCPNGYDGLDPACCIAPGDSCVFRDQCCNLLPCVPINGTYVCQQPQCIAAGEACVPGGTLAEACCNELPCLSDGAGGFVCRYGPPPGPDAGTPLPGPDASTPVTYDGGPGCLAIGATCTSNAQCCSNTCTAGELGSTCTPPIQGYDDAGQPVFYPWDGGVVPRPDAGPVCKADGLGCSAAAECCSGGCKAGEITGTCGTCKSDGNTCATGADCCSGNCTGGKCTTCKANGTACTAGTDCCSGTCSGGTCTTCKPNGTTCTANAECCSTACLAGEISSTCGTPVVCMGMGGTCTGLADCCSGLTCQIAAGQPTGTCQTGSTCSSAGQSCSMTKACCLPGQLRCESSSTSVPCTAADTSCVCRIIIN
ncbi:MAG TPA: hypothetical protein VGK67_32905 [Myxococcales bacterium]|jgi:hypothetical protein